MPMILNIAEIIFIIIQVIFAVYLLLPGFLLLVHYIIKPFSGTNYKSHKKKVDKDFDFAAIVTAHQDTRFIAPLVDSFLKQTYHKFKLYVVADDCDISGLNFNDERIVILKPEPALHAKIKSIRHSVNNFHRPHDVMIIFDSDNLVHPEYLEVLNHYFQRGYRAVQTHMLSKNFDTVYAKLDSVGHIFNNFTERTSRMDMGFSSCILGLGIAVETKLYGEIMYKDGLGGFDKKLQAEMIKKIPKLAFAEEAIVYDEKVDDGKTLERQRTRWIHAYFKYFNDNWKILLAGLKGFNLNRIYFGFTALRPPLFITLGAGLLFLVVNLFLDTSMALAWTAVITLFILSFVLIVISQSRQKGMASALFYIPVFVMRQVIALLNMKKASHSFLKTEHTRVIYIEDLLKNEMV